MRSGTGRNLDASQDNAVILGDRGPWRRGREGAGEQPEFGMGNVGHESPEKHPRGDVKDEMPLGLSRGSKWRQSEAAAAGSNYHSKTSIGLGGGSPMSHHSVPVPGPGLRRSGRSRG